MKPDYTQSIVNLSASLAHALGAEDSGYAPLAALDPGELCGRPLALLLIDGLGDALLEQFPDSHLARARVGALSSVFPSTTASALTSLATAVGPQQHAITGWHMWLRELGSVAAILPFTPRHGGCSYSSAGWTPQQFIGAKPWHRHLHTPLYQLAPEWLRNSDYSRTLAGSARRLGSQDMADFFAQLVQQLGDGQPQYLYAYWCELDSLAHRYGSRSSPVRDHFLALDRAFAEACSALSGSGALLLASADHGFIDTTAEHTLKLEDHPDLAATLALPLCGEGRAPYCYVRPGREADFLAYVQHNLAAWCEVVPGAELISLGWFGLGAPHPRLHERVGDYVLLMRENYVLRDRLANEKPFIQLGVHGGISAAEMNVPLLYHAT